MKFKNKLGLLAIVMVISAALFLSSCKKEQILEGTKTTNKLMLAESENFSIQNGVMIFQTIENLNRTIDQLSHMNQDALNDFNQGISGFTSLYRQYQIMDANAENEKGISADSAQSSHQIVWIADDLFASLVNKDGLLAVGDSLYKYEVDGFKVAPIGFLDDLNSSSFNNVEMRWSWGNWGNQEWASFAPESHFIYEDDNGNTWPKHRQRPIRATHTTWCTWYAIYASSGSRIKMEKKTRYAGWINWEHQEASINCKSPYRYWTFWSDPRGGYWDWEYYYRNYSKNNSNKNVCGVVTTIRTLLANIPIPLAGPLQHQVGNYVSTAYIKYGGNTLHEVWIH